MEVVDTLLILAIVSVIVIFIKVYILELLLLFVTTAVIFNFYKLVNNKIIKTTGMSALILAVSLGSFMCYASNFYAASYMEASRTSYADVEMLRKLLDKKQESLNRRLEQVTILEKNLTIRAQYTNVKGFRIYHNNDNEEYVNMTTPSLVLKLINN